MEIKSNVKVENKLKQMQEAYKQLYLGSLSLLEINSTYWTERLLLKLVHSLAGQRLGQIKEITIDAQLDQDNEIRLKESLMEAAVEAALGGHDLAQWQQVENGWQAACKLCQATIWIGENGLRYSLLEDSCSGGR